MHIYNFLQACCALPQLLTITCHNWEIWASPNSVYFLNIFWPSNLKIVKWHLLLWHLFRAKLIERWCFHQKSWTPSVLGTGMLLFCWTCSFSVHLHWKCPVVSMGAGVPCGPCFDKENSNCSAWSKLNTKMGFNTHHHPPQTFRQLLGNLAGWNLVCKLI